MTSDTPAKPVDATKHCSTYPSAARNCRKTCMSDIADNGVCRNCPLNWIWSKVDEPKKLGAS